MSNVIGICIILGLVAFSTAMIVGIVKRVREIQKEKKERLSLLLLLLMIQLRMKIIKIRRYLNDWC